MDYAGAVTRKTVKAKTVKAKTVVPSRNGWCYPVIRDRRKLAALKEDYENSRLTLTPYTGHQVYRPKPLTAKDVISNMKGIPRDKMEVCSTAYADAYERTMTNRIWAFRGDVGMAHRDGIVAVYDTLHGYTYDKR